MRIAFMEIQTVEKQPCTMHSRGRNQHVGTGPCFGRKKESPIKKGYFDGTEELVAVDLPGAYSMSPFTSEESITSSYVKHGKSGCNH